MLICILFSSSFLVLPGLPWWLRGKESACTAGATGRRGFDSGLERSPGKERGNPLQYTSLENPMDRGAWRASPWVGKELATTGTP